MEEEWTSSERLEFKSFFYVIIVIIVLINACDKYSGLLFQINTIIVAVCASRAVRVLAIHFSKQRWRSIASEW